MENSEPLDPTPITESETTSTSHSSESNAPPPNTMESPPPPVQKEFAKEPTAAGPRAHGAPDPEPQSKSSKEIITGEVMGFQATEVIQKALDEIAKCHQLHHLSERSSAVVGMALQNMAQQTQGMIFNFQ